MDHVKEIEALLKRGANAKALSLSQRIARAKPKDTVVLELLARAFWANGETDKALATYDRIARIIPRHPKPLADKAHMLQRMGRGPDANTLLRRALKLAPLNGSLLRMLAATARLKADDPAIVAQRTAWDAGKLAPRDQLEAGFALFGALGASGLPYLARANALQRKANPWRMAERQAEIDALQAAIDAGPWPEIEPDTTIAPLFVTGMPRSGTTLVEQILSSHSSVSALGETGFPLRAAYSVLYQNGAFVPMSGLTSRDMATIAQRLTGALRQAAPDASHVTDKSIQSFMVAGVLKRFYPRGRLIYVRRDPRDIGWSIWRNHFSDGTHGYSNDQRDIARQIKAVTEMVSYWRAQDPDMFIEVSYEALVRDPGREIPALLAACDLPMEEACLHPERNTRSVQTLSIEQVRQPISPKSIGGWRAYADHLAPMIETLKALDVPWD